MKRRIVNPPPTVEDEQGRGATIPTVGEPAVITPVEVPIVVAPGVGRSVDAAQAHLRRLQQEAGRLVDADGGWAWVTAGFEPARDFIAAARRLAEAALPAIEGRTPGGASEPAQGDPKPR